MAWVLCEVRSPLPRGAFQAGYDMDMGVLFVGRTIEGEARLGHVPTDNGCVDGKAKTLYAGGSKFEHFQVLVVTPLRIKWLPFQKDDALPEQNGCVPYVACNSRSLGKLYIGRDASGHVGPVSLSEGTMTVAAFSPANRRAIEGHVLAVTPHCAVACGANFVLKGTVLPHSKKIETIWNGHNSHFRYTHSSSYHQADEMERVQERMHSVEASTAACASAGSTEGGDVNTSTGAAASADADATAKVHGDAGLGGGIIGSFGGPTIKAFADAGGFARMAAHAAAEAALSVAANASESVASQFAQDFHAVVSSTATSHTVTEDHKEAVEQQVGVHRERPYEVCEIDNLDSERSKYIYQLFLWVQYADGHEQTMATLLLESTLSAAPPIIKPGVVHQFGLRESVAGERVDPKLAWERHQIEAPEPAVAMRWAPFLKGMLVPKDAFMVGSHDKYGQLFLGRNQSGLLGCLGTTTGDRDGLCESLLIHRRGYLAEYQGILGKIYMERPDSGELLIGNEKIFDWLPIKKGTLIPASALSAGFEPVNGPLYVGRDAHGMPGKLVTSEGKANDLWCAETSKNNEVAEVLVMKRRVPVSCGAEFHLVKSILGRQVQKVVVTSGDKSEASSRTHPGIGHVGASAGLSTSAGASLQEKIEASIGGVLWSFLGGPHAEASSELKADAYAALKLGAEAAAGASLGVGASLAIKFASDFVCAAGTSAMQSSSKAHSSASIRDHVTMHTSGMEETMIVSNEHDDRNLHVYQLFLWVKFQDGSIDNAATLLTTTTRSDVVPEIDAKMLERFGL